MNEVLSINGVVTRIPELRFEKPLHWTIKEGEQWAVIGPNGAGKTLLSGVLQKKFAFKEGSVQLGFDGKFNEQVKSIAFKDIYSLADCKNVYYQQRWHSTEIEVTPLVCDLLETNQESEKLLSFFNVKDILSKRLLFLSSGELRKFLIIRTLLTNPRILILDNPFIGLDITSRELLVETLNQITQFKRVQIVLLLSDPNDIPSMITHVLPVFEKNSLTPHTRGDFFANQSLITKLFSLDNSFRQERIHLPIDGEDSHSSHHTTLRMENVSIKYGDRTILKDLNWEVKNGEKWALVGANGAGKSTLLSLVYADNPQSYANTFFLFDKKRGTGESIWDIKKRIGYVSPEIHLHYKENVPVLQIVGSGFFDSIGLHRKCDEKQQERALNWMSVFAISLLKDRFFSSLSTGEQRLALLARAFVKDPDLLILDEPLHGLDICNKKKVTQIIEQFCSRPGKSLIYVTHYPEELPRCVDKCFKLVKHS